MNSNNFIKALASIESDRNINKEIIIDALKGALEKAYCKQSGMPDAIVRVEFAKDGKISMYQQYRVVEEVEIDDAEISLENAKKIREDLNVGDIYEEEVDVDDLGRAAAIQAKNVLKQKLREAEKQSIYDEYIDKLDEMVLGSIESVEEKFIVVNLGKTLAVMPKLAQIPGEMYYEGQKIRVVVTEVSRETKGAQVLVSRADPRLVRRLFEKEVPEIESGIVEIKAIAREAGERTKMAVYSKSPDIDPVGACIGPRGQRIQVIIDELKGEKIDVFEWSDDMQLLIKHALAPAEVIAVVPSVEKKGLLVVVDESQLSLAIGKKGKNARLAYKLVGSRIDIKTKTELEEAGIDYKQLAFEYAAEQERIKREKAAAELARIREEEAARLAELNAQYQAKREAEETAEALAKAEAEKRAEEVLATEEEVTVEETVEEEPVVIEEPVKPAKKEKKPLRERTEYVSRFEDFADGGNKEEAKPAKPARKKKQEDDSERRVKSSEMRKDREYEIKIEYSEEELEEIEAQNLADEETWDDDIDYDEYDEYYDDEN